MLKSSETALSGVDEINNILLLLDREDDGEDTRLQRLRLLSTGLKKMAKNAESLRDHRLQNALSVVSPQLQTVLSAQLPECDTAAAMLLKQLLRIGNDTPREAINVQTLLAYDAFVEATARFLVLVRQLMTVDSEVNQEADLEKEDARLLLMRVASTCQDISKSSGLLLASSPHPHSRQAIPDTLPPAYEEVPPPPFGTPSSTSIDARASSSTSNSHPSDTPTDTKATDDSTSTSFLHSLTGPLLAAISTLLPKPDPLVPSLCRAASHGSLPLLRSLLSQGANPNGRDTSGHTPLTSAVIASQLPAATLLLSSGADTAVLSSRAAGRKPPLYHAVDIQSREMVDLLVRHGADPNQADGRGHSGFVGVVTGATPVEWVEVLLDCGADANTRDFHGRPAVILALKERVDGGEEVARLLLRRGARVDARWDDGTPLVVVGVQQRRGEFVRWLLGMGADADARDVSGRPVLIMALRRRDVVLVEVLLGRGADANARDVNGVAALLVAWEDRRVSVEESDVLVEMLLRRGARGDVRDSWGTTALELVLGSVLMGTAGEDGKRRLRIADMLLENGADPNQKLRKVEGHPKVLAYARDKGLGEVVDMLVRHGGVVYR